MNTSNKGFTLVELLMTLVVSLILIGTGIPSMGTLIKNNRLTSTSNQMITDLSRARSEAIKRGRIVTLCPANADRTNCDTNRQWDSGWIAFSNADQDEDFDASKDEMILRHDRVKQVSIVGESFFSKSVCFSPRGVAATCVSGNGFGNGRFSLCDSRNENDASRQIIIAPTGRVRVIRPLNSDAPVCT